MKLSVVKPRDELEETITIYRGLEFTREDFVSLFDSSCRIEELLLTTSN